jgi:hypothetical protein
MRWEMADPNLRLKLESGASRVFNCLQLTRGLRERRAQQGLPDPTDAELFFASRHLNNAILIKETNLVTGSSTDPFEAALPIRTKLFIPYNVENPYEGGQSTFTDEAKFEEALEYVVGTGGASPLQFQRDLEKIRLIEKLPSLDPFLLRDRLHLGGLSVNDAYFRLSMEDWANIRRYIRSRFELMAGFAFGEGGAKPELVDRLVDRIWEAQELEALHPLLLAFGLPVDKAGEFFQCWKGIAYFEYEFNRNSERMRGFSTWLQSGQPRGFIHRADAEMLDQDRAQVRAQIRTLIGSTLSILKEFNDSFDKLFRDRESARPFAQFMLNSRSHFWRLGSNLNGIYHAIALWSRVTQRVGDFGLPPAQMVRLMRIIRDILTRDVV